MRVVILCFLNFGFLSCGARKAEYHSNAIGFGNGNGRLTLKLTCMTAEKNHILQIIPSNP